MKLIRFFQHVWPTAQKEEDLNPPTIFKRYREACESLSSVSDKTSGPRILNLAKSLFDEEEARRLRIEATAHQFLSVVAVAVTLIVAVAGFVLKDQPRFDEKWGWKVKNISVPTQSEIQDYIGIFGYKSFRGPMRGLRVRL